MLVAVRRVPDPNQRVRILPDGSGVDLSGVRAVLNPFDEVALEAAVRLRERGVATEIVAASVGGVGCKDVLRTALALGADRAAHVPAPDGLDALGEAKALRAVVVAEAPRLVLVGRIASDTGDGSLGPMLAGLLDWPQATDAIAVRVAGDGVAIDRASEAGIESIEADLPCVVTVDLRLNTPRFASLSAVLKAKKQPIEERSVSIAASAVRTVSVQDAARRRAGVRVASAHELVAKLRAAGVL